VKIEHFALQVPDPIALAQWYATNLGLTVARAGGEPAHGRFLLDSGGSVMLEVYHNPKAPVPDYRQVDPLLLHMALLSEAPAADRDRLVQAGASLVEDLASTPGGDQIVMLRDPWGVALQLVKRAQPMLEQGTPARAMAYGERTR
jgi:hypothetical protein